MISVVMPFYNAHKFIEDALVSLNWQTYKDFELIIVDDGSDPPVNLGGSSTYPIKYVRQEHRGTANARNRAIQEACGEYILPLDADDILIPTALERLMSKVGHDIVYCNYLLFGSEHQVVCSGNYEIGKLKHGNYIINTALFKKSVWESVKAKNGTGYDEQIPAWEDWLFWLEAETLKKTFYYIPEWLFLCRKTGHGRDQMSLANRATLRKYVDTKMLNLYQQTIEV